MSKRVSTLLGWIEAREARCISEQAILARRENEREKSADESSALAGAARDLITTVRGVRLWLAQAGQTLRRRRGRAEAGLLLVGFFAGIAAVAASPSLGWAQTAAAPAVAATEDGAGRSEPADFGAASASTTPPERADLWRAVREQVLPGRLPEDAQELIWRRLWQLDPSFRESDGLDSLPAERAEEAAEGRSAGETDALALRTAPYAR